MGEVFQRGGDGAILASSLLSRVSRPALRVIRVLFEETGQVVQNRYNVLLAALAQTVRTGASANCRYIGASPGYR